MQEFLLKTGNIITSHKQIPCELYPTTYFIVKLARYMLTCAEIKNARSYFFVKTNWLILVNNEICVKILLIIKLELYSIYSEQFIQ